MRLTQEQLELKGLFEQTYKHWQLFNVMPDGWRIDLSAGSPLSGYDFITDGKSVLNGGKRGLLRAERKQTTPAFLSKSIPIEIEKQAKQKQTPPPEYAQKANELARSKFIKRLLADIRVDMQVCELEGWDKMEYLNQLKDLITSIGTERASA